MFFIFFETSESFNFLWLNVYLMRWQRRLNARGNFFASEGKQERTMKIGIQTDDVMRAKSFSTEENGDVQENKRQQGQRKFTIGYI